MKIKVVTDSSANLLELKNVELVSVPLRITIGGREFLDTPEQPVEEMMRAMDECTGPTSTACPSVGDWLEAFGDGEKIFAPVLTGSLSGCYNSAAIAAKEYMRAHPRRKVYLIDTLSTGPEMELLLERFDALIGAGADFDAACRETHAYLASTGLVFMLGSLENLARNGRVSPALAKLVGLLNIRIVGRASEKGELEPINRCRGERRALDQLWKSMCQAGYSGGRVRIRHTEGASVSARLRQLILDNCPGADVRIQANRVLCSYYAEHGGILVGFETIPQKRSGRGRS